MTSSQIFRLRCLLLVFASYSTVIILLYSYYPPNPDQAIYDQMGEVIARGGVIYRDCADMNFPGEPLIHALALKVFGDPLRSYRLLDGVLLIAFTAIVALELAARGRPGTGTAFLFVYPLMYITSGTWFAGQRDILAAHAGLLAGLCLVRTEPAGRVRPLVAGLLLFAAVLIKPTYLLFAPGLLLVDLVANRGWKGGLARVASRHAAAWVTLIAAVLLFAALARHARVLDDWYDFTIRFNTQVYAKDSPVRSFLYTAYVLFIRGWHWYTLYAILGFVLLARGGDRALLWTLAATFAITLVSVVAQRKGFGYHFGGCLTVLGILAAETLAHAVCWVSTRGMRWTLRLAGLALIAVAAAGFISKMNTSYKHQIRWHLGLIDFEEFCDLQHLRGPVEVARYLQSHTAPQDTVWTYDHSVLPNNLAGRRLPFRFTCFYLVKAACPPFEKAGDWLAEVRAALDDHPPRYIVLRRAERPPPGEAPSYSVFSPNDMSAPAQLVRRTLARSYRLEHTIHDYDLFVLTSD